MAENSAGSLIFTIGGDASGMLEAARAVQSSSNNMVSSLNSVSQAATKTWSAFGSLGGETVRLNTNMTQVASGVKTATSGMSGAGNIARQLGYQLQDVAVQAQMGTSGLMILGQQGSQVASVFGPAGAVVGAILAVAAAIGSTLFNSVQKTDAELEKLISTVDKLGKAQKDVISLELNNKLKANSTAAAELAQRIATLNNFSRQSGGLTKGQADDLVRLKGEYADLQDQAKGYSDQLATVNKSYTENTDKTKKAKEAYDELMKSLNLETTALKEGDRAAAKLAASQKLGEGASKAQIAETNRRIDAYYDEKEAQAAAEKAKQAATSAARKDTTAQQQNAQRLTDSASKAKQLETELANLKSGTDDSASATSRYSLETAKLEAQRALGATATQAQIDAEAGYILRVHQATEAIANLKKKQAEDVQTTQKFETVESKTGTKGQNVQDQYNEDLKALENYHKMAGASDARYLKTKAKLEEKYRKDKQAAAIEDYKAQSEWNTFLMDGLDALGQSATTTIAGLASGTMTATEAMQNFANIILNQAVGALVSMGIEALKNQIVGQAAAAASVMAAEGTAAAITSAYAPAAFMANTATMGGASATGLESLQAGVVAAKALGVAGGRQFGGSVNAGGMYRVGENGRAEVFTQGGRNYLLPGDGGGQVTPMSGMGGGGFSQNVSIVNTSGASVSHNTSADGKQMRILVEQTVSKSISEKRGRIYSAFNRTTNLQSRAR